MKGLESVMIRLIANCNLDEIRVYTCVILKRSKDGIGDGVGVWLSML